MHFSQKDEIGMRQLRIEKFVKSYVSPKIALFKKKLCLVQNTLCDQVV